MPKREKNELDECKCGCVRASHTPGGKGECATTDRGPFNSILRCPCRRFRLKAEYEAKWEDR